MRRLLLLPVALLGLAGPAAAQSRVTVSVAGGHHTGPPGSPAGPDPWKVPPSWLDPPRTRLGAVTGAFFAGGWPGSLGFNGYGPAEPVPFSTPGSFGQSDSFLRVSGGPHSVGAVNPHLSVWGPGVWWGQSHGYGGWGPAFGLGWLGYRTPSPRPRHPTVSVHPPPAAGPTVIATAAPSDPGACLRVAVKLPDPNAELQVENTWTTATGADRLFESPPLQPGQGYRYTLTAKWTENGKPRVETRSVVGTAGDTVAVDFTRAETARHRVRAPGGRPPGRPSLPSSASTPGSG